MFSITIQKPDIRNINEQTYQYIRQKIMTNQLKPGTRINYDQLCEELNISKTPLRDAMNRLAQENLIVIKPRSGTFVNKPSIKDAIEVYDVRKALERLAMELAFDKIPRSVVEELWKLNEEAEKKYKSEKDFMFFLYSDRKIHDTIINYSDNGRLINMMEELHAHISWFGYLIIDKIKERTAEATESHFEILQAMLDRNKELSMKLIEEHIEGIKLVAIEDFAEENFE